jgi:hypothetical protein
MYTTPGSVTTFRLTVREGPPVAHYLKDTFPEPMPMRSSATAGALLASLHFPFFSRGPCPASVKVNDRLPLIPAYAPVPLTIVTRPLATPSKEQLDA